MARRNLKLRQRLKLTNCGLRVNEVGGGIAAAGSGTRLPLIFKNFRPLL